MSSIQKHSLLIPEELNKNNFDFFRFLLSIAVIFSHCYVIYYGAVIDTEPVSIATKNQLDLGGLAVDFFFIISGFLIVKSFKHSKGAKDYMRKRILRIVPGFFVAFILSVFLFAPIGTINAQHQFGNWQLFFRALSKKQALIELFTLRAPHVPFTVQTLPLPNMINESLWTIEYEFICYLVVLLLGIAGMIKKRWIALAFLALFYSILVLQNFKIISFFDDYEGGPLLLYPMLLPRFFTYFFAGSCCYLYREVIPRNALLLLVLTGLAVFASSTTNLLRVVLPLTSTYFIFYFAYHPKISLHHFAKRGDFSYGLYLYGWPAQQLLLYFFKGYLNIFTLFISASIAALVAAWFSWNFVEKPFLKMKNKFQTKGLFVFKRFAAKT